VWKDTEILLLHHQIALLERRSAARPKLTWADRALMAALTAVIPRPHHSCLRLPVTPAAILRRHRDLVKRRWAAKSRPEKPGRPRRHPTITRLVLRMARDNEQWGYRRAGTTTAHASHSRHHNICPHAKPDCRTGYGPISYADSMSKTGFERPRRRQCHHRREGGARPSLSEGDPHLHLIVAGLIGL
jgi:hypothetical protein